MKKLFFTVLLLLFSVIVHARETQTTPLTHQPERWTAGNEMRLEYNAELSPLKGEKVIEGVIYFWEDYHWVALDMDLTQDGNIWRTTIQVPSNATFTTMKFISGEKKDNGGENLDYSSMIFGKDGHEMPSCYIAWSLLRGKNSSNYSIPNFLDSTSRRIDDEVLQYWYRNELRYRPQEQKNVLWYIYETWNRQSPGLYHDKMEASIPYLFELNEKEPVSEEIWLKALNMTQTILRNDSLSNVLTTQIKKQYPDGILARDEEMWRIYRIQDMTEKTKEFEAFLKRFPSEKFMDVNTETTTLWLGKLFRGVIYTEVIKNNNYQPLLDYLSIAPYDELTTFYWHLVQIPYQNGQVKPEFIMPYAKAIYNEKMNRPQNKEAQCYSPKEWKRNIYKKWKEALLVHAHLKNDCGDREGAIALMDTLNASFEYKSAEFNSFYVDLLAQCGRADEVIPYIKKALKENAATPSMLDIMKAEYLKTHSSEDGFDSYINSLKSEEERTEQQNEILGELINKPIQLFKVETLEGSTIDMSQLKGKIIVLDFWATWCAPCKAAMAGMQLAVNKHKEDNDVVFLFVSTMETDKNYKKLINDFMTAKGYNLQVVLDNLDPKTNNRELLYNTYSKAFSFSGIPQKMIIDGKGQLRWRGTGYKGSPSALADEISYLIEYLKKEQ
jgi:thiol-disulfide isomerase/thioredoxin